MVHVSSSPVSARGSLAVFLGGSLVAVTACNSNRPMAPRASGGSASQTTSLLAECCAHFPQPLQRAQDLRLIVGKMAHDDVGVPKFP